MTRLVLMADDGGLWSFWNSPSSGAGEITMVVALLFGIALAGFIWAAFWRKPRRRKHAYRHASPSDDLNGGLPQRRKRKSGLFRLPGRQRHHHRQHRQERPVNPTLAQVGGLPPARREPPPSP
jgi:hypothetical protein